MVTEDRKLVEPLRSVTVFAGGFLLVLLLASAILAVTASGSVGGFGHATVCVTQPNISYGVPDPTPPGYPGVTGQPGTTISVDGTLQACASHPTLGQRFLYTLTTLPSALVWAGVLYLLWRLTALARRSGPFTAQTAAVMRLLGWFILIGSVIATSLQGFATDALLRSMLRQPSGFGDMIPTFGSLAVPGLAAVALLTFARFITRGVAMEDEIKGTV
jgi:hypothetical protein